MDGPEPPKYSVVVWLICEFVVSDGSPEPPKSSVESVGNRTSAPSSHAAEDRAGRLNITQRLGEQVSRPTGDRPQRAWRYGHAAAHRRATHGKVAPNDLRTEGGFARGGTARNCHHAGT